MTSPDTALPVVQARCKHESLGFASGGFYIQCANCKVMWVAKTRGSGNPADADLILDYDRSGDCLSMNDQRLAHTEPATPPDGWRLIASAPKDGTHILLAWSWDNGTPPRVSEAFWRNDSLADGVWWYFSGRMFQEPTHWMPLPAAPDHPAKDEG